MRVIASGDGDGLSDGREAGILQNLHCLIGRSVLEHGEADLFLHDIDSNLGIWLRKALGEGLLDLACAIGASNSAHLNGVDSGTSALMYF